MITKRKTIVKKKKKPIKKKKIIEQELIRKKKKIITKEQKIIIEKRKEKVALLEDAKECGYRFVIFGNANDVFPLFCNTKEECDETCEDLLSNGYEYEHIHYVLNNNHTQMMKHILYDGEFTIFASPLKEWNIKKWNKRK